MNQNRITCILISVRELTRNRSLCLWRNPRSIINGYGECQLPGGPYSKNCFVQDATQRQQAVLLEHLRATVIVYLAVVKDFSVKCC